MYQFHSIPQHITPFPNIPAHSFASHCRQGGTIRFQTALDTFIVSHYSRFHSNPQHCPRFRDIPPRSITFHSAKEGSALFPKNHKPSVKCHYSPLHSISQLSISRRYYPQCSFPFNSCKEGSIKLQPIKHCLLHHIKGYSSPLSTFQLDSTTFHHVPLHSIL